MASGAAIGRVLALAWEAVVVMRGAWERRAIGLGTVLHPGIDEKAMSADNSFATAALGRFGQ